MARGVKTSIVVPALWIAFFTFAVGMILSLGIESFIATVEDTFLSFIGLVVVILLGIISDAVGTATTAAQLAPFNSMASQKIPGARQAVRLVRNADLVANLTADMVGDISGTLSGAIGAAIVFSLSSSFSLVNDVLLGAVMTSFIAAATVGGKTIGKSIAIRYANPIVFRVGKVLYWWESLTGKKLLEGKR